MGTLVKWFGAAAAAGLVMTGSVGCVGTSDYNHLKAERDQALMQRDQARVELTGLRSANESYQNQLGALSGTGDKDGQITSLTNENNELRSQLAEINSRYTEAMDTAGAGTSYVNLPPALKDELTAFAAKNKDLVEFDAAKGVVRFKSDATFAPGSADLTPKGVAATKQLASILASKDGAGFELMVAGHTDATPISKTTTIKAGHKDNWYLSAHRAITVGQQLQGNHVHPRRLAMVGYADQRPVSSNATDGGRAQNRRVEVIVMPTKLSAHEMAAAPKSGKAPSWKNN
jgi:chemotaxis protein MotB